jgi:molecular chaperone Hsp33
MSQDLALRAITNDGAFRIITLCTTDMVRGVLAKQLPADPDVARLLGELVTGSVLVRETMSPELRVQLYLRSDEQTTIVADAHPDGMTRGLFTMGEGMYTLELGEHTHLQVTRVMPGERLHQGIVETNQELGLSSALTGYMLASEQIASWIEVRCVFNELGEVALAGGFIVQILPEVTQEALRGMTEHLERQPELADVLAEIDASPEALMERIMRDIPHTILQSSPVHYGCNCSQLRVLTALGTLGRDDIEHLIEGGEIISTTCDYCHTTYTVSAAQLRGLLENA